MRGATYPARCSKFCGCAVLGISRPLSSLPNPLPSTQSDMDQEGFVVLQKQAGRPALSGPLVGSHSVLGFD